MECQFIFSLVDNFFISHLTFVRSIGVDTFLCSIECPCHVLYKWPTSVLFVGKINNMKKPETERINAYCKLSHMDVTIVLVPLWYLIDGSPLLIDKLYFNSIKGTNDT